MVFYQPRDGQERAIIFPAIIVACKELGKAAKQGVFTHLRPWATLTGSLKGAIFRANSDFQSELKSVPLNVRAAVGRVDHHPKFWAFTLVELLVVIAIIAIVFSLILASFSTAMTRARATQCLSQLKQLGLAMSVYGADHNELLPAAHSIVPWNSTNPIPWTRVIFPQPTAPKLLTCPSYSEFNYQSPFSYFMGSHAAFVEAGAQPAPLPLRHIRLPSQYILSGDCNFPFGAQDADPDNYTDDTLFALVPVGHGRRVNVLFGDLHALSAKRFEADSMTFSFTDPGRPWE